MSFKRLQIEAKLRTPIIIQGFLTFDALMAGLLFERFGSVSKAHEAIPIHCDDGLFSASAASLEIFDRGGISLTANLRAKHDMDPDHIKKSKDGSKLHRALRLSRRRDFGAVLNSYRTISSASIKWDVVGHHEEIKTLLSGAYFIGKKRTAGFGEVSSWSVSELDDTHEADAVHGLIGKNGEPLRPIPVDRFHGDKTLPKTDTAWKPAYWDPENRAACFAPEPLI